MTAAARATTLGDRGSITVRAMEFRAGTTITKTTRAATRMAMTTNAAPTVGTTDRFRVGRLSA